MRKSEINGLSILMNVYATGLNLISNKINTSKFFLSLLLPFKANKKIDSALIYMIALLFILF